MKDRSRELRYLAQAQGVALLQERKRVEQMVQVLERCGLGGGKEARELRHRIAEISDEVQAKTHEMHQQNRTVVRAMLATFTAADLLADMANDLERAFKTCCVFQAKDDGLNFVHLSREASTTAAKLVALIDEAGVLSVSNAYARMADPITDQAAGYIYEGIEKFMDTYQGKINF